MIRVNYCQTCHGRGWQLHKTLPHNLRILNAYEQILIVFYDDLESYESITEMYHEHIADNFLSTIFVKSDRPYNCSYVKNIAHFLSDSDVVFNLDADNFIDQDLQKALANLDDNHIITPKYAINERDGKIGRIGITKNNFIKLGGYNTNIGSHHDGEFIVRGITQARLNKIELFSEFKPVPNYR